MRIIDEEKQEITRESGWGNYGRLRVYDRFQKPHWLRFKPRSCYCVALFDAQGKPDAPALAVDCREVYEKPSDEDRSGRTVEKRTMITLDPEATRALYEYLREVFTRADQRNGSDVSR